MEKTPLKGIEIGAADETLADRAPASATDDASTGGDADAASHSESEDEAAQELRIAALETALAANPFDYYAYVEYIRILRKLGHVKELRLARESMNAHFPLSPEMWQEWTKDETSLSASFEGFAEIEKLFERGVSEYLSVPLWCDYLEFVEEYDPSVCSCAPDGLSKMRNLFEAALTAAGLHVSEGNKIWEAYREFEQAIFVTIDDNDSEEKSKQVQRIRLLFHRQLSVPSFHLVSTIKAYKHWENEQGFANDLYSELDGVPKHIASSYRKALEMYNARAVYENRLLSCVKFDDDRRVHYMDYIKYEESNGDPARVQILYERAVCDFPVSSDIWLGYTSYLDRTLKVPSVLKCVYSRATRNCMWVADLWVSYLLSLERIHASESEISDVFERSILCVFPSFKEYMDLFLVRVDGLRRRICFSGSEENKLEYVVIRETFQRAVDYLYPQVSHDILLDLHAYWAHLEVSLGKDLDAARGVWENLIKTSGSFVEVWQSYLAMEIEMGNLNEARSIYKRCYKKWFSGTGSEDVCHSWLRFESKYGSLGDLDLAVKKVTRRLNKLCHSWLRFESKYGSLGDLDLAVKKVTRRLNKLMKLKAQQDFKTALPILNTPKKRNRAKLPSEKQPTTKKRKTAEQKYVDSSYVVNTGALNEEHSGDLKPSISKTNRYTDKCTAFISNLPYETTKGNLEEFFSDSGVTDVRILRDRDTGLSRGLAYADFSDDAHLTLAIGKDGQKLHGKKLHIARSNPGQSKKKAPASSSTRGRGRQIRERMGKVAVRDNVQGPSNRNEKTGDDTGMPKSNNEFRDMLLKK